MHTVAVFDSEPIAIEGLRSLLQASGEFRVVAAGTSLKDGLEASRSLRPAIVIADKAFGINLVVEWIAALDAPLPRPLVIVWGFTLTVGEALRFLQSGASGVMRKTGRLDSLLACTRAVAAGGTWMEEDMLRDADRPTRAGRAQLTARERQVVELVERGMRNRDIAVELGIRVGTVKIHIKHIFEKTGIRGRYGLALSGLKEKGLIEFANVD